MKKKYYLVAILLLLVGFAAVSTTLYLNGSTNIIGNKDDFKVYYSDAKVNDVQDLSIVESETSLRFNTELDTLGQTYVIEYDVTNSSKNYDADLEMVCTGGDEYLSVNNLFDDETNLPATETRVGTLTLTLARNYVGDAYDVDISCTITANAVERASLGTGTPASPVEPIPTWKYTDSDNDGKISVGDILVLASNENEVFNIISQTDNKVTMLAQYNLGEDYRQTKVNHRVPFASSRGWEYTPGPKEIDIQKWSTGPKTYVNEYVSYLKGVLKDDNISGDLITLQELEKLECVINDDYANSNVLTCNNSKYITWLKNNQYWWTRSAGSSKDYSIWYFNVNGALGIGSYGDWYGIRPTITISKDTLNNL